MDPAIASASQRRDITAGLILILSALGSLIAVAHHPVIEAPETNELLTRIRESAFADRFVHGALILFIVAQLFAFCRFTQRQGIRRAPVLFGLIFYVLGTVAMISAALIDGFLVPKIGESYLDAAQATTDTGLSLLRFCSIAIQLFTKSGVIAISAAILLWSASLIRTGRAPFLAALVGVAAVLSQVYLLVYRGPTVTAHTVVPIVAAMAVWVFCYGLTTDRRADIRAITFDGEHGRRWEWKRRVRMNDFSKNLRWCVFSQCPKMSCKCHSGQKGG